MASSRSEESKIRPWWEKGLKNRHKELFNTVGILYNRQKARLDKNLKSMKLYGNYDMVGMSPYTYNKLTNPALPENRVKINIISSMCDTVSSKVSKMKPRVSFLTGGGAYNCYFIERLGHHLDHHWIQVEASNALIEFKEALVFAFLGLLKLRGEVNTLASVTSASQNSSGGTVFG